jgi:hypothetical protein
MPVQKGPSCVGNELRRFKQGQLHSGKSGKVVTNPSQAKAIALSACGQSKYAEMLQSMGYSEETAEAVTSIFAEIDWQKQFETGKGPGPRVAGNYEKDEWFGKPAPSIVPDKSKRKDNPKQNDEAEMLSPVAYPKGPGNPQGGSSKEVFGLRMLG